MKHGNDRLRTAAAPFVARGFWSFSSRARSAGASSRTLVQRALALVALAAALAGQTGVAAYDVCTDDYAGLGVKSCAHEQMFDEAMRFYTELVAPNRFSQEIIAHAAGHPRRSRRARRGGPPLRQHRFRRLVDHHYALLGAGPIHRAAAGGGPGPVCERLQRGAGPLDARAGRVRRGQHDGGLPVPRHDRPLPR